MMAGNAIREHSCGVFAKLRSTRRRMIDLGAVVQDSPLESRRELPNIVSDASRVRPRCRTETLGKCRCQLGDLAQMGFYRFDPFPVLGDMRYVIGGCVRKMDTLLPRTFHHAKLLSERNEKDLKTAEQMQNRSSHQVICIQYISSSCGGH